MVSFPPPDPSQLDHFPTTPGPTDATSRRRIGVIALITSGLLVGAVVVGSQFVTANTPSIASSSAAQTEPIDTTSSDSTPEPDDETGDDEWSDWAALLPEGIADGLAAFEEYGACMSEQLGEEGDIFFGDDKFLDGYFGSVVVDIPAGDDIDWSSYDFGEGDGSITITKNDGEITVSVDGDITEFDEAAHEAEFEAFDARWVAAAEACADLLPEGLDSLGGIDVGDFEGPFSDFDLGEFDLGEFDLGEFDLGDLEGQFGDLEGELAEILELLD